MQHRTKLRRLRESTGLTQRDFARKAGVALSMYNQMEQGYLTPSATMAGRVTKALGEHGVDASDLWPADRLAS
jgi:transcriptional regulator with XRE-family HTH domain